MDPATRTLVLGGMVVLAFGLLLGIPMVVTRARAPRAPPYLKVEDGFAEKSAGNRISGLGMPLAPLGAGILLFGVVTAI